MRKKINFRPVFLDLHNAILSKRFLISVVLGCAVCYFTLLFCGNYQSETMHKFALLHDRAQSFLAYITGILPFSLCFYEDIAHGNIRNIAGRIRLKDYVLSKTIAAYLSTILAFTLGKLLFVAVHSMYNPICLPGTFDTISSAILYSDFALKGHYYLYFFLTSLHKSFYCAILCQIVMLFSILLQNVSVIYSIPIAVFYVAHFYLNSKIQIECLNLSRVFDGVTIVWKTDAGNFIYAFLLMIVLGIILYRITLKVFQRKMYHE